MEAGLLERGRLARPRTSTPRPTTLTELLAERRQLAPVEVANVLTGIARALAFSHDRGIAHCELTPENVVIVPAGPAAWRVDVVNAGVSRMYSAHGRQGIADSAGAVDIETLLWAAPEVLRGMGEPLPAADVWSIGIGAFWLLTGQLFWRSATIASEQPSKLIREVIDGPMPKASDRALELGVAMALPAGFDDWFIMCTELRPERRFHTARSASAAFGGLA